MFNNATFIRKVIKGKQNAYINFDYVIKRHQYKKRETWSLSFELLV